MPDPLPTVLVTNAVPADVLAPLDGLARVILGPEGGNLMSRPEVLRLAPQLAGIVNQGELRIDAELLACAPRLKVVTNIAIGVDNLDRALMERHGVQATNVPDAFVESTADLTLGALLAVTRRIIEADRFVRSGAWRTFQPGRWDGAMLAGKTLGLIGHGAIGKAVAKRARGFGMKIVFYQRTPSENPEQVPLDVLLGTADVVSLHLPINADSARLLDASRIARMKPGAILVNAARGRVVDEAALVAALQSGHLAGAALDVFEDEPRVNPALLTMTNVVLTPHIGGGTRESRRLARLTGITDVARVLRGLRPLHPVNSPAAAPAA